MRCPHCDAENPDDAIFCFECGSRIVAPAHFKVEETIITARQIDRPPADETNVAPAAIPEGGTPAFGTLETPAPITLDPNSPQYDDSGAIYDTFDAPPRRKRWPLVLGLALLIAALVGGAAWVTYDAEIWGGRTLPNVVGMPRSDAEGALSEFAVTVVEEPRDDSIGIVTSMIPKGDRRVPEGSAVKITVGVARLIPEVIGMSQADARQALLDAGAKDIMIVSAVSSEPEGTVIACDPAPGSEFVSTTQVTITIAQARTLPNVVGKPVDVATETLADQGFFATVQYVESDRPRDTVVSTEPAPGSKVDEGATVTLMVPSPDPTDRYHLFDYFDMTPQQVANYLGRMGFSLDMGAAYDVGALAHYTNQSTGEVLFFTHTPESGHYSMEGGSRDVLAEGVSFVGVRFQYPADIHNQISTDGVHSVMDQCGLSNLLDFCTEETIVAPADTPTVQSNFICAYGEQGDYVWAVCIGGYGLTNETVVLVLPKSQFEQIDLSNFGGGICDYIAYVNYFTG